MSGAAAPPMPPSQRMLRDARVVLEHPEAMPTASWALAVAVLARRALELGLEEHWLRESPDLARTRARKAQFIALRFSIDPELAGRLWVKWSQLSDACHHHAYELPPTATELTGWLETVEEFVGGE